MALLRGAVRDPGYRDAMPHGHRLPVQAADRGSPLRPPDARHARSSDGVVSGPAPGGAGGVPEGVGLQRHPTPVAGGVTEFEIVRKGVGKKLADFALDYSVFV